MEKLWDKLSPSKDIFNDIFSSKTASYIAIAAVVILGIVLVAFLIKFVFRLIFSPIRFIFSLLGSLGLVLAIGLLFAKNPIVALNKNQNHAKALVSAMQSIEGVYSKKLPLIAWKIEEVTVYDGSTKIPVQIAGDSPPLKIKVDYLPFGSILLSYNPTDNSFSMIEDLASGEDEKKSNLEKILKPLSQIMPKFINQEPGY